MTGYTRGFVPCVQLSTNGVEGGTSFRSRGSTADHRLTPGKRERRSARSPVTAPGRRVLRQPAARRCVVYSRPAVAADSRSRSIRALVSLRYVAVHDPGKLSVLRLVLDSPRPDPRHARLALPRRSQHPGGPDLAPGPAAVRMGGGILGLWGHRVPVEPVRSAAAHLARSPVRNPTGKRFEAVTAAAASTRRRR